MTHAMTSARAAIFCSCVLSGSGACTPEGDLGQVTDTETSSTTSPDATSSVTPSTTDDATSSTSTTGTSDTGAPLTTSGTTGEPLPCGPPCAETFEHQGNLDIMPGADLAMFACMTRVTGRLQVVGDFTADELAPLGSLQQVDETLFVGQNPALTAVPFLGCLESAAQVFLVEVPMLTDASGLGSLKSATTLYFQGTGLAQLPALDPEFAGVNDLSITGNQQLTDLERLDEWPAAAGTLSVHIAQNPLLQSIAPLEHLVSALPDNGWIKLESLPALTSIAALGPVSSGSLHLIDLPLVDTLAPLANLTDAEDLVLQNLPALTSLAGLEALGHAFRLEIGGCEAEVPGLPGIEDLTGLDALATVNTLVIANNINLDSLAYPGAITDIARLGVIGDPLIDQAEVDAFLDGQDGTPEVCVGGWDVCACPPVQGD